MHTSTDSAEDQDQADLIAQLRDGEDLIVEMSPGYTQAVRWTSSEGTNPP
jgi:hypothetical protein